VKNNVFKNIRSPEASLAEHAIHFWRGSVGTIADGNQIINCDRGIGFGLGGDVASGHIGGLIMNNFVYTSRDVGIGLESSTDTKVYNNTVITDNYSRSIEYRFPTTTNASIVNNLVSGQISDRSSGSTGTLTTNYTITDTNIFTDAAAYDYHLSLDNLPAIIDAGTFLTEVVNDIDCDDRNANGAIDIGADEFSLEPNTTTVAIDEMSALLQGPAQQSNGNWVMNAQLVELGLIPQTDPYENLVQFEHISNAFMPEAVVNAILSPNANNPIVDWVFVELRSASNPAEIIATRSALIRNDGKVVTTTGAFEIAFSENIPMRNYHVAIRHRNHLGVMTANPIDFSANDVIIDFTNPNEPTWGANAQIFLDGNTRALWAGNANIDDEIIFQGADSDNNSIFFDVLNATENIDQQPSYVVDGYFASDLSLDAKVIFSGFDNDVNTCFFNILSHPENITSSVNYVITEQLP